VAKSLEQWHHKTSYASTISLAILSNLFSQRETDDVSRQRRNSPLQYVKTVSWPWTFYVTSIEPLFV
jgi:hypothetical protein